VEEFLYEKEDRLIRCGDLRLNLAVLGATGSVGSAVMNVARAFPEHLKIVALVGGRSAEPMGRLIEEFSPARVGMYYEDSAKKIEEAFGIKVYSGEEALIDIWRSYDDIDALVVCVPGLFAFKPVYEGLRSGKKVFFASKEALVVGGEFIMKEVKLKGQLVPLDSEHWSIFSFISEGQRLRRIFLTASGGSLRDLSHQSRKDASVSEVLRHPIWKMGKKITVDSATLMNKGFEVIEAYYLFGLPLDDIKVLVHREAWVHGMVEFADGSIKALLFYPDMRLVVQEALLGSSSFENPFIPRLDLRGRFSLTFEEPDMEEYPCLNYAYYAARMGGNIPVILNAADEVAVSLFLSGKLKFGDIPKLIRKVLFHFPMERLSSPEDIYFWDREARSFAGEALKG